MESPYWWPLVKNLAEFLPGYEDETGRRVFQDILIYAGTMLNSKTFPCIEILWISEKEVKRNCGCVHLQLDICLQNNDAEPAKAYEKMHRLQSACMQALSKWEAKAKRDLGIAMFVRISGMASDSGLQRPVCQSRIMIEIEWRVSTI